jgi:NTP pyrophosphatase (non-canonical NTP hydrolase)
LETPETIIDILVKNNGFEYNLSKASEELQELSLVLTQKLNKPHRVDNQEIIDEIGDVIIRIEILKKIYDIDKINERVAYKLSKFASYVDNKKYKKI